HLRSSIPGVLPLDTTRWSHTIHVGSTLQLAPAPDLHRHLARELVAVLRGLARDVPAVMRLVLHEVGHHHGRAPRHAGYAPLATQDGSREQVDEDQPVLTEGGEGLRLPDRLGRQSVADGRLRHLRERAPEPVDMRHYAGD